MREYFDLYQDNGVELKSLKNQGNLPGLIGKTRSALNRPSPTRRKALAKRKERNEAEGTSTNCQCCFVCSLLCVSRGSFLVACEVMNSTNLPPFLRWMLKKKLLETSARLS